MMDKQMIEEMARGICGNFGVAIENKCGPLSFQCDCKCKWFDIAERFYNAGYRKIPEGAVVLTREYYEEMCADVKEYEEYEKKLLARLNDVIESCQKKLKSVLEKVWDNATTNDEVGARWILLQIAKEEGVKLDRELKKYGTANKPL